MGLELERRGEAIARNLASYTTDPLLTDDLYTLYEMVNQTKHSDANIRYIIVQSPGGTVRVSTFGQSIPRGIVEANMPLSDQASQLRRLKTEEGLIRDISMPILQGKAGTVRVGVSDQSIEAVVRENTRSLGVMAALSAVLGFAASYWLAYYLTRPLSELVRIVQMVAGGNLSQRISSPAGDEVGQLGKAFNSMSEALVQKEASRQALQKKVIYSQEEERKRVARELHDELAQRLTSIVLSLETIESKLEGSDRTNKLAISRAREIAQDSLTETRKLIGDLRPSVLDDLGLVPAIRSYAENRLHSVPCEVVVSSELPKTLPPAIETAVFRIVQEAINNIVKHARAKSARITLGVDDGKLCGSVSDDGRGFQLAGFQSSMSPDSGFGLLGMQERAELMGGNLSVRSREGLGTDILFSIPLSPGNSHG